MGGIWMTVLTGNSLTIEDVVDVACKDAEVIVPAEVRERIGEGRSVVEDYLREGRPAYGVNTGFGALCDTAIPPDWLKELQENLVRSHASGAGEYFSREVVRAAVLLRANSLCRGHSGVRPVIVDTLVDLLNKRVVPAVHSKGSLGASGDLAPLADLALVLTGEGMAWLDGKLLGGGEALRRTGITPLRLEAKEGLALLNGTAFMTAVAALALHRVTVLLEAQDAAAALSLAAFRGTASAYSEALVAARPHPGAMRIAGHLRGILEDSGLVDGGARARIQDPYCFRCVPQVHGAVLDAVTHARRTIGVEINSTTDNPLVIEGKVLSGGNFHGQPVGAVMDYLSIVVTAMSAMAERRINQLLHPAQSGLPAFLTPNPGLNSGLMIPQYTAASLVNENRVLASPASVHSIPVCADQEDHVSMATLAARKAMEIADNATVVAAVELLAGAQALDLFTVAGEQGESAREPWLKGRLGARLRAVYDAVRGEAPFITRDAVLSSHLEHLASSIRDGRLSGELSREGCALKWEDSEPGARANGG